MAWISTICSLSAWAATARAEGQLADGDIALVSFRVAHLRQHGAEHVELLLVTPYEPAEQVPMATHESEQIPDAGVRE